MNRIIKNNIKTAGGAVLMLLMMYCTAGCFSQTAGKDILPGGNLSLISHLPIVDQSGKLLSIDDTVGIYYHKRLILYKLPYKLLSNDTFGNVIHHTVYKYLVQEQGAEFGFLFDTLNASNGIKVRRDSILANKLFSNMKFYNEANDSLVRTSQLPGGNGLVQVYASKKLINESYNDTTYLYYTDSLKNISYSFSTALDSVMKMKLYKIRLLYNKRYSEQYKMNMPEREFAFEIKALPATVPSEIVRLFENVQNHASR